MPKAKYEGIYRSIKKRIEAQDYPYQSLLPSENTLIAEYDCSRNTVRRALAELIADGYVQSMQGRGVRVIYQPVGKTTFTIGGIETFQETARRNRLQAVTRVIRFETIIATEQFAEESGFSEGDELWAVQRVPDSAFQDTMASTAIFVMSFRTICNGMCCCTSSNPFCRSPGPAQNPRWIPLRRVSAAHFFRVAMS